MYTKKTVYTKKNIRTEKKTKKNHQTFVFFCFFVYTNIRVNNFPLCKKACLWHAFDSQFRTLASYFLYCTKMESCKNLFCALSFSPKKSISSKTRDFSRTRFVASQRRLQENLLLVQTYLGGQSYCSPPFNPPNPVSSRFGHKTVRGRILSIAQRGREVATATVHPPPRDVHVAVGVHDPVIHDLDVKAKDVGAHRSLPPQHAPRPVRTAYDRDQKLENTTE
jgi:hypothetical protein